MILISHRGNVDGKKPHLENNPDYINNALKENGLLVESSEKSNEMFNFKVGKHIFEGRVTKIKKLS